LREYSLKNLKELVMTTKKNRFIKCCKTGTAKVALPEGNNNLKDKAPKPTFKTRNNE
jgi:hypothetical protein